MVDWPAVVALAAGAAFLAAWVLADALGRPDDEDLDQWLRDLGEDADAEN